MPMAPRAGDVNLDGAVSITDVTSLIDLLLSGSNSVSMSGDVNLDGSVTISDVTALIDMLLSGETDYTYPDDVIRLSGLCKDLGVEGQASQDETAGSQQAGLQEFSTCLHIIAVLLCLSVLS